MLTNKQIKFRPPKFPLIDEPAGPDDVVALAERLVRPVVRDPGGARGHERRLAADAAHGRRQAVLPRQHLGASIIREEETLSREVESLFREDEGLSREM